MELTRTGYLKQINLLLGNQDYARAYEVASELARKSPGLEPYYMLGIAAYWNGKFKVAAEKGQAALSLAKSKDDIITCSLLISSAFYRMGEYKKGFDALKASESIGYNARVEEMLIYLSVALRNEKEALRHTKNLFMLNRKMAIRFMERAAKNAK